MWRTSRPPPTSGFVLNLDCSVTRWDSTTVNEVDDDHPDYEQMVSFHEYQEPKADDEQMAPFFKLMDVLASSNHGPQQHQQQQQLTSWSGGVRPRLVRAESELPNVIKTEEIYEISGNTTDVKRVRFENQPAEGPAVAAAAATAASVHPTVEEREVPKYEVSVVVSSAVASSTHQPPQQVTSQPTTTTAHQPTA